MGKLYLDLETHEVVSGTDIFERELLDRTGVTPKFEWLKIYPAQIKELPAVIESPAYRVAHEVLYGIEKASNEYKGSYEDIAKRIDVPRITVARVMKKLQDGDYIRPVKRGVYMANPAKVYAGDKAKRYILGEKYANLKAPSVHIQRCEDEPYGALLSRVESLIQGGNEYDKQ